MKKQPIIPMEDDELWIQLLQGNKEVIEKLYRKYYSQLFRYGVTLCHDQELVRDCIQDLFVKLFQSEKLKPTLYVRAYLIVSIRNLIYDKVSAFRDDLSLDHEHYIIEVEDETLTNLFAKNDVDVLRSKKLLDTFKNLPKQQQSATYLRFVESLSYKEISIIMDINLQSCKNLVARALKKFREEII